MRLFEHRRLGPDPVVDEIVLSATALGGEALGELYETLVAATERRRTGLHLTPVGVAGSMVSRLEPVWLDGISHASPPVVVDPAVGGGVFLLVAADAMVGAGATPDTVVAALHGYDLDPDAVAIAEAAVGIWSLEHGLDPAPVSGLVVADGLLDPLPTAQVVLGNPPFLNQLRGASAADRSRRDALRDRWGDLVGAYTDEAWLFLAAAVDAARPGGQVVLLQPLSVLAARHGARVRSWIAERMRLRGLWVADGPVFDVPVEVCAPFLMHREPSTPERSGRLHRWIGSDFASLEPGPVEPGPDDWGRAGAHIAGVPAVSASSTATGTLRDLAAATAGFRDQFYGFAPHVGEAEPGAVRPAPLITVGMIDPFRLRRGDETFRFAGSRYARPDLDLETLEATDESLASWVRARRRPKLLVATQTRVLEAWVDVSGTAVPATPVISVEPDDPQRLFAVAAVVMAPLVTADAAARAFGTAMSVRAIKLSAKQLLATPLPVDHGAWEEGARLAETLSQEGRSRADAEILAFAEVMNRAYGVPDDLSGRLTRWWRERWPRRT